MLIAPPDEPNIDFNYRIFNNDGNEVEHCGNGARCLGKYVHDKRLTGKQNVPETASSESLNDATYGTKQPLVRKVSGSTRLTIFDGAHEGLPKAGLTWLARQRKP